MVGNSSRKPFPPGLNGRFAHDSTRRSRHMPSGDGQIVRNLRSHPMTAADFRRIALSLEGVEEYSHAGLPAFRESLLRSSGDSVDRSEEHTSELQSRFDLVCRLLL